MNEQNPYNQTPLDQGSAESGANSYHAAYGAQPTQPQQAAYTAPHVEPVQIPNAAHVAAGASGAAQQVAANPQHAEKKHGGSSAKTFLIAFAGALLACLLAFGVMSAFGLFQKGSGSSVSLGAQQNGSVESVKEDATLAESVADKCLPSVVSIDVYANAGSTSGNSIYDYLYGGTQNQSGVGSGIVISDDGYVITNYHVVEGGTSYRLTIDGQEYSAELVGGDSSSDVAVLKVDGSGFTPIAIGDSDNITIGEWVMAIGSPFGLEQSVSTGIVSATSRSQIINSSYSDPFGMSGNSGSPVYYPNLIQTDAAINPGNSGGALVDSGGNLIGINTLITSYSGNYAGVGFAIPVNYAINIAQSLISGEEPTHAQLGVNMSTVDNQVAQRYGLSVNSGALVSSVIEGSPAAEAGIQAGDVITSFDGTAITSASDLMLQVRTKNPGDNVTVKINRDGQDQEVTVTLAQAANTTEEQQQQQQQHQQQQQQNQNGQMNPFGNLFGR